MDEALIVLDVGKTHSKLSLLDRQGAVLVARSRANARQQIDGRAALDAIGIEAWLLSQLAELARITTVGTIIPVAHGATAALISADRLAAPVLDYEQEPPFEIGRLYDTKRDAFERTLSPRLPQGLNLGAQLFWQEQLYSAQWPQMDVLLWPQYWAWRLCGVQAAEMTSLGCHTDLWFPSARGYSDLSTDRGWDRKLGALRSADETLGTLRPEIARETGLTPNCRVLCGIHDSNAALNAARGLFDGKPFSLVSTGTWFVAMQSGAAEIPDLDPARDTLANVDWEGRPVPSARFMGGREYAAILRDAMGTRPSPQDAERLVARGVMARPSFVPGSGPYPDSRGEIFGAVERDSERAALASLHLALMTDASLDLVSATGPILIEGRFADDPVFPPALATLRPDQPVFKTQMADGVTSGAARLIVPELSANGPAERVALLALDLSRYRGQWRDRAAKT